MSLMSDSRVSLTSSRVNLPSGMLVVFLLSFLAGSLICTNTSSAQTITTLVSFNGSNGSEPGSGNLVSNANGDLFGTTYSGGAYGEGTIFEIVNTANGYAATPTILVSFDYADGAYPISGLIIDADGDLFGTTESGGAFKSGTVFEVAKNANGYASTPATIVSFDIADGSTPQASLIADANGDLFGTTSGGGAYGDGTVFEIAKTTSGYANTPVTLVTFDGYNGGVPLGRLLANSNGDLFGTTLVGGASGHGTVFEILNTASGYDPAPVTLISFGGVDGQYPYSGLITDANGDLFGTTRLGGTSGYGTVFEIANFSSGYSGMPTTLVNFDNFDGAFPRGDLIADANGNLFGTTESGWGTYGAGTVFEVAKTTNGYASAPTTEISLGNVGGVGSDPYSGLIADLNGNLFGTTFLNNGTVYEVTGSGFVPPKQFAGSPGTPNCNGDSISTLAQTYGGIAHAAASLGYSGVPGLQSAVNSYCSQ